MIRVYRRSHVSWVDGFSVNDPASAVELLAIAGKEAMKRGYTCSARLFNHRADRPSRLPLFSGLLDRSCPNWVIGSRFPHGWDTCLHVQRLTGKPSDVVQEVESTLPTRTGRGFVVCLGNVGGEGGRLRTWLRSNSEVETW
jgi:hypothetical protein